MTSTAPRPPSAATLFPAEQYDNCPVAMKGLSYDWNSMTSLVNRMKADGTTNQTIGLVSAWMSLTGGGPFTVPAKDSNYKYQQTIVLISDGLNTENRWDGNGSTESTAVDARMALGASTRRPPGDGLHRPREHERRPDLDSPEELRHRHGQVLHRHIVGADRNGLQPDRHAAVAAAHLEVTDVRRRSRGRPVWPASSLVPAHSTGV